MSNATRQPVPVTVLTGFLGAGKTTLLNRILTENHGRKIAVIENEFGKVGVDNQLVIQAEEELFEMNNGCICCTVRGDLIRILHRLAKRKEPLDAVLIETTGLADPGPVAQTFFTDADIREMYRLDGIVTVVDARHIALHLDDSDEARKQVAFADVILLNKTDLLASAGLDALETRIRNMNAMAKIHRTQTCALPIAQVLDVGGFSLRRATEMDPNFLETEHAYEWAGAYELPSTGAALRLHEGPDSTMDVVLLPLCNTEPETINAACADADRIFSNPETILRPGDPILGKRSRQKLTLSALSASFPLQPPHRGPHLLLTQHHPDEFNAAIEIAGEGLAPVWSRAFRASHTHNEDVTSVGFSLPGEVDGQRFNDWISGLLRSKGNDIFRSKGVLAVRGSPRRLVFQGVHMLFDGTLGRPWGTEPRANIFVIIGRNLDRAALTAGFQSCLAI